MRKRLIPALALSLLCASSGSTAVFTTTLRAPAIVAWNAYIARFEHSLSTGPALTPGSDSARIQDLNPSGQNGAKDVPDGYIHHWIGVVRIPGTTVAAVRGVLEDYPNYATIYSPDVKFASAAKLPSTTAGETRYDVRLVTQQTERFGIHFAFDVRSNVTFHQNHGDTFIDSRSYLIRESDSGRAPYTDLLPEGEDHGILWRLNSYWRLRQSGNSVIAECQVISLSRNPLPGMTDQVKSRAKASLTRTLKATERALESGTAV